jgi:hypothetical protein
MLLAMGSNPLSDSENYFPTPIAGDLSTVVISAVASSAVHSVFLGSSFFLRSVSLTNKTPVGISGSVYTLGSATSLGNGDEQTHRMTPTLLSLTTSFSIVSLAASSQTSASIGHTLLLGENF